MPVDSPETMQAGALEDIVHDQRRTSVSAKGMATDVSYGSGELAPGERHPSPDELHGPKALRRVAAPIPWAVYTVAFVELCERFSYYGTQVVCKSRTVPLISSKTDIARLKLRFETSPSRRWWSSWLKP